VPTERVAGTEQLTDADLRSGEITIVNFWASWCPPCRAEHPTLLALAAEGYRVAGVNFRDQAEDAAAYLTDDGNPFFATGFDPRGRIAIEWGVSAPPETFIVGPDGTVLSRFIGPLVGSDFEQRFMPMLRDATGETQE
jgi:cytochrome c biogenesis protein CcmG/thiol:disulfide interchange protein DsbE